MWSPYSLKPDAVHRRTRARINPALTWTHDQDLQGLVLKNPVRRGKRPRGPKTYDESPGKRRRSFRSREKKDNTLKTETV